MTGYLYFLMFHLAAFGLFTGVLVTDVFVRKQLWAQWQADAAAMTALWATTGRNTRLMGISLGIALLAGILMMTQVHMVYGAQLWMRIKIALVLVLVGLRVMDNLSSRRLKVNSITDAQFISLKNNITVIQMTQLAIITTIIFLSVKKIN